MQEKLEVGCEIKAMNGSKDNNGTRNWKAIYAQWDRKRLEEELVRNAERMRAMRDEQSQLRNRVRQLEEENRVHAAELRCLSATNRVYAEAIVRLNGRGGGPPPAYDRQEEEVSAGAAVAAAEFDPEPVRQNSGRFHVSPVEVLYPDPVSSRGYSEGVEAAMLEQERREARRLERLAPDEYQGSEGMQLAEREMRRRAADREEERRQTLREDNGIWG